MPRPPDHGRRQELVDALVGAAGAGGIGDRSLRDLAASAGTSHRMLIHHFGSREGVMLAIVEEVERRQMTTLDDLPTDPTAAIAAVWANLRRRELRPFEGLFFECYARGAQGEAPFDRLPAANMRAWLGDARERGLDETLARLLLATIRGLLLDLVGTGDEDGVNKAAALFAQMWGRAP